MSSSPYKNINNLDIIKIQLLNLKSLKKLGVIKEHEEAQMIKLENDLIELENSDRKQNKESKLIKGEYHVKR